MSLTNYDLYEIKELVFFSWFGIFKLLWVVSVEGADPSSDPSSWRSHERVVLNIFNRLTLLE